MILTPLNCGSWASGFNSDGPGTPGGLVVKSDGTVWFTDPSSGCLQFPQECYLPNNVYRFDPNTNVVRAVIENLKMPKWNRLFYR